MIPFSFIRQVVTVFPCRYERFCVVKGFVSGPGCVRFYLDLLRCPLVQIDRFDPGDVDTQVAVDAGTADTHEHPEVP